ncbi:MAG: hypothetical protein B7Y47_09445 [Sphingomonas sp. 28-63-12]|nr:MAG: hypothetical protein B7Y47_09445 [Sphingomonas sp. 28-63-12]
MPFSQRERRDWAIARSYDCNDFRSFADGFASRAAPSFRACRRQCWAAALPPKGNQFLSTKLDIGGMLIRA